MKSNLANFETGSLKQLRKSLMLATALCVAIETPALAAPDGAEEGKVYDSIVVTATRRAERLIDVPSSIQALDGQSLEQMGAVNFSDYARTLAGVSFIDSGPGRSQIFIRGVTTGEDIGQGLEATVGVYLDETPISEASSQPDLKLYDIDRIEVLRGPQGTVYGSGSLGGTIRVLPRMPEFDAVSGSLEVGASTTKSGDDSAQVNGWINVPLTDKVALRAVGYKIREGGYLDDGYSGLGSNSGSDINDEDTHGGRLALRVKPSDQLDVVLTGIYQKGEFGAYQQVSDNFPGLEIQQSADEPFEDEYKIANLKVIYDFDFATLTSATSHFDRSRYLENDIDYFLEGLGIARGSSPLLYEAEAFSQEIRLTSNGSGPLSWLVGAFYLDRNDDFVQTINPFGVAPGATPAANLFYLNRMSDIEQLAGFVELGYDLTDRLNVSAGVRVSNIDRKNVSITDGLLLQENLSGSFSEDSTTPKFNVSYKLAEDALVYFQAAQGFRIGGVNPGLPPCDPMAGCVIDVGTSFDSDSLWNYEIGSKSQMLDGAVTLSASLFYIDWEDIQLNVSRGDGFDGFLNAGEATSKGAEVEATWVVSDFVTVGGQVTYTDTELREIPATIAAFATEGQDLPSVPKWSSAAHVEVSKPVSDQSTVFVRGDVQYVGERQSSLGPASGELDAYTLVSLRGGLEYGPYAFTLFVENLTDERAELHRVSISGLRDGSPLTLDRTTVNRPRTFGVSVKRSF